MQEKVLFELRQVEELIDTFDDLLASASPADPGVIHTSAAATLLHSFYTAMERIFMVIATEIDGHVPSGSGWHRGILLQMTSPTDRRPAVIDEEVATDLTRYLAFRHFFRHAYAFSLDWSEMCPLVMTLRQTWAETLRQVETFLAVLGETSPH